MFLGSFRYFEASFCLHLSTRQAPECIGLREYGNKSGNYVFCQIHHHLKKLFRYISSYFQYILFVKNIIFFVNKTAHLPASLNRNHIYCTVQYTCSLSPFIPVYKNNTGVQFHSKHLRAILQYTYKQSHTRHSHSNYSPFKQSCFLTLQKIQRRGGGGGELKAAYFYPL
jgi:hypothetical protein